MRLPQVALGALMAVGQLCVHERAVAASTPSALMAEIPGVTDVDRDEDEIQASPGHTPRPH